ncbi:glycine cleavage system protein R [Malonomonas rubra]|uniref:glycine cleavage system protein R n=1 Tax=Malonomonas rubra TaxID=57040 RepID=UPI0026ED33AB|nr:ACT domain-containing protein [Malonomonas rubra]
MGIRYIMTAFGKDRVGIVADVTRLLYENDCNLEDTTMSMLADEFTLSLLFSSQNENIEEKLAKECRRLELEKEISAFVRPLQAMQQKNARGYKTCTLHIEGLDQAGIVYKTSQFLADNNLNILTLNSTAKASPESGATIYSMDIHIQVPEEISLDEVEENLTTVADELHVDVLMSR